jgi:hypothetical protein
MKEWVALNRLFPKLVKLLHEYEANPTHSKAYRVHLPVPDGQVSYYQEVQLPFLLCGNFCLPTGCLHFLPFCFSSGVYNQDLPKDNIIKLMLSNAGCFLKKYESSAPLLIESLLQQGNFTKIIVVLLSILLLCHSGRNEA